MKEFYLKFKGLALILFLLPLTTNAQVWIEDFDGSNTTNPPVFSKQCGDNNDYFDIICVSGCANTMSTAFTYNGAAGQFLGVRDMDASPCSNTMNESVAFNGIDISLCCGVSYVCFTVAESRNMGGATGGEWGATNGREDTWDGGTNMTLTASIDGAPATPVTAIEAFDNSDTRPGFDLDCSDNRAEDPGEPELTDTFTEYCFELPTTGSSLDLTFEFNELNSGGEDIAIDNISVHCGPPPSGTVLPSCTPFVLPASTTNPNLVTPTTTLNLFYDDFDGGNFGGIFSFPACNNLHDSRDYFSIMCQDLNSGSVCSNQMNNDYAYYGYTGQFLGARDMDRACTAFPTPLDQVVVANGINIAASNDPTKKLILCFDMAESQRLTDPDMSRETFSSGAEDYWDSNCFVDFNVYVDGATTPMTVAAIRDGGNNPAIDTNCDGTGDGTPITPYFTTFCFEIAATGSTMDLEINIGGMNTDGEDIAIDNVTVICTNDLFSLPALLQQSCTAPLAMNVPTMGEWALFILFLLMINLGGIFIMAGQRRPTLATANGQKASMDSVLNASVFNKPAFMNALKHAFGLAIIGFAIIYIGWGEIVFADIIGMLVSIPLVAFFIHLFYTKE